MFSVWFMKAGDVFARVEFSNADEAEIASHNGTPTIRRADFDTTIVCCNGRSECGTWRENALIIPSTTCHCCETEIVVLEPCPEPVYEPQILPEQWTQEIGGRPMPTPEHLQVV